jgi:acyl carrier protein
MFKEIQKLILEKYNKKVTKRTKLKELEIDSLDSMELLMEMETVLDINIPENVLRQDITFGEILNLRKPN